MIGVVFLHLKYAPFTKVEESFNLQATHDVLASGVVTQGDVKEFLRTNYDHVEFPGSVPRTFIGAIALTLMTATVRAFGAVTTGLEGQGVGEWTFRWCLIMMMGKPTNVAI